MNQNQRQTDSQTSKIVGSAICLCRSTQYNEHKYAGKDNLSQQATQHADVSLQVVSTCTLQSWHILGKDVKQQ